MVTKPGMTSAHAGELEVGFSEVVLHSAKPLPAAVPGWPVAPSPALGILTVVLIKEAVVL